LNSEKGTVVRILASADIHGNHRFYRRLLEIALGHGAQALVLAGDLLGYPAGFAGVEEAQRADAANILGLLEDSAIPVFYIMGNDDLIELGSNCGHVQSLHMRRLDLGGYNFVGYQYSLPFMGGIFEKPEESIGRDLVNLRDFIDERTIFVTHSPAQGTLDTTVLGTHAGSNSISEFVGRFNIRAHIHGHIHACFGREGRHFNVAAIPSEKAVLINIKEMSHKVVSLTGCPERDV
jgi:Icc-related predicted phosphoesterase